MYCINHDMGHAVKYPSCIFFSQMYIGRLRGENRLALKRSNLLPGLSDFIAGSNKNFCQETLLAIRSNYICILKFSTLESYVVFTLFAPVPTCISYIVFSTL
jgi:hypothetical protein